MKLRHTILAAFALIAVLATGCASSNTSREIAVSATANGFEPAVIDVKQGDTVVLVLTRTEEATCATEAHFEETGRKVDLALNAPQRVEIPTASKGTIHYACAMNMWKGEVRVN